MLNGNINSTNSISIGLGSHLIIIGVPGRIRRSLSEYIFTWYNRKEELKILKMKRIFTSTIIAILLLSLSGSCSASLKHYLSRTRRTVTGLRTKCIPYVKKFCQRFTVRGVTKRFCVARTAYICTALDWIDEGLTWTRLDKQSVKVSWGQWEQSSYILSDKISADKIFRRTKFSASTRNFGTFVRRKFSSDLFSHILN